MRRIGRKALSGAMALLLAGALVPAAWANDNPQEAIGEAAFGDVDDIDGIDDVRDVDNTASVDNIDGENQPDDSVGAEENEAASPEKDNPSSETGEDVLSEGGDAEVDNEVEPPLVAETANSAETDFQANATAAVTSGWKLIGTCEWQVDASGCLRIRPAGNAAEGQLPNASELENLDGYFDEIWPWGSGASSVALEGAIRAGDTLRGFFAGLGKAKAIKGLSTLDTSLARDMRGMFYGMNALESVDLSGFDTSQVEDMGYMFSGCESLVELDVSSFRTAKVTNMEHMFGDEIPNQGGCGSVKRLDLSNFDTSNVTNMGGMFSWCYALTELNISSFNTAKVTSMNNMFDQCESLTTLDLGSFDTSNVARMDGMFNECATLRSLNLQSFDTRNAVDMYCMFRSCYALTELNLQGFDTRAVGGDGYHSEEGCKDLFGCTGAVADDWGDTFQPPLQKFSIGPSFTLRDYLPNKTWYNKDGKSFSSSAIPAGVAGTYATSMELFSSSAGQTSITLSETSKKMTVGDEALKLIATVVADDGQGKTVEWVSSETSVASVDANGVVTPMRVGATFITARSGLAIAVCKIEVEPLVISSTADSVIEAEILIQDAELANQLDGYALRIVESEAKGSNALEQSLTEHVRDNEGESTAFISDIYDIDLVNTSSGAVFDWTESDHSVVLKIRMNEDMRALAETHDFSVWYCNEEDGEWSLEAMDAEVQDGYLVFWTNHLSTYAVTATERSNGETGGGEDSNAPGDSNTTAGTDSSTASGDKTSKKDTGKKDADLAQTSDDMPARATLLLTLVGVSAFLLMLSLQNRRAGRRER